MKCSLAAPVAGLALLGVAAWTPPQSRAPQKWAVILGGDTDGYLSPCGCTEPMSGGIRRRARATKELAFGDRTVVLDNGSFVVGTTKQDQMKARTVAEALTSMGVTAVNFGPSDAQLGRGFVLSIKGLLRAKLTSASLNQAQMALPPAIAKGPFIIAGISADATSLAASVEGEAVPTNTAVQNLVEAAESSGKEAIVMLQGTKAQAEDVAKQFPTLSLIQYRSPGDPPDQVERVGNTVLATVGERGKSILRLIWDGKEFSGYSVVRLGPGVDDDANVSRLYGAYLENVGAANLLAEIPRTQTAPFAGSSSCRSCHAEAFRVWSHTGHARALATLEARKESRDPDCVGCHVTGLASTKGFRSRSLNPQLSFVGCESCHGPALAHMIKPAANRLPHVGESQCVTCHTSLNSPNFDFKSYWRRIKHS